MARHIQTRCTEGFRKTRSDKGIIAWKTPSFIDQFGRRDSAALEPFAVNPCHYQDRVVEQNFYIQILIRDRRHHSPEDEVDVALAQVAVLQLGRACLHHIEHQSWKLFGKSVDNGRD